MISELDIPSTTWKIADQIELFIEDRRRITVVIESTKIKSVKMTKTGGIAARVLVDNKPGWSYSPSSDVEKITRIATNLAKQSTAHEKEVNFVSNTGKISYTDSYCDSFLLNATVEDINDLAEQLINTVQQYDNINCHSSINVDFTKIRVINSNGVDSTAKFTKLDSSGGLNYRDPVNDIIGGMIWYPYKTRFFNKDNFVSRVEKFCQIAQKNIKPVKKGNLKEIIFSPLCIANLIISGFIPAIDAKNVYLGKSPLADRIGEKLANVTITNRINDHEHGTSMPFDTEGTPTKELIIADKGILVNYISNSLYSNLLGFERSTGNLYRASHDRKPQIGINTLSIQPLETGSSLNDMIEDTKQGIIANGFAGNVNPANGSFSGLIKASFAIEKGEQGTALKEVNIRGNIYELLKQEFTSDGVGNFMGIEAPFVKYAI